MRKLDAYHSGVKIKFVEESRPLGLTLIWNKFQCAGLGIPKRLELEPLRDPGQLAGLTQSPEMLCHRVCQDEALPAF